MPIRVKAVILTDPIFNGTNRTQLVSNALTRMAKRFKRKTVEDMVKTPKTGRLYQQKSGLGFTRSHVASSRGNPPAVQTGNLIRNVEDKKVSKVTHEVFVDDNQAPYGQILERPRLNRTIMSPGQVAEFENTEMVQERARLAKELIR